MSRFDGWDEDEEFPGQFALQEANTNRSLLGPRGQASLRALEVALLALPAKRLIDGAIVDQRGDVCAMGALAMHQGKALPVAFKDGDYEEYDEHTAAIGKACGVPRPVAIRIAWMNDQGFGQTWRSDMTPEERYEKMLSWVRENLHP